MPRIRSLKPDIWIDEAFGLVSIEAQCLFVGLITQADDEGRLNGSLDRLRIQVWPYKPEVDAARVDALLDELAARELIQRYTVGGKPHVFLLGWDKNQRIDRPTASEFPPPPDGADPSGAPTTPREESRGVASPRPGREGKGEEGNSSASELAEVGRRCFAYWQEKCGHPNAKFTLDRRRKLQARLKEGYGEADVRKAIDGAARAAFVNPDTGKRFDDLELICRSGSKLEDFIGRAVGPRPTPISSRRGAPSPSSADIVAAFHPPTAA